MTGPRQTDIIPVVPGEPISQEMLRQVIDGANKSRNVTSDGSIGVTQIGGNLGLSVNMRLPQGDRDCMVLVLPPSEGGTIGGGFYYGKRYAQPIVTFASGTITGGTATAPMTPYPYPNAVSCIAVNLPEVSTEMYGGTGSTTLTLTGSPITQRRMCVGRRIGVMTSTGLPAKYAPIQLVAIEVSELATCGTITGHGGSGPVEWNPYTVTLSGSRTVTAYNVPELSGAIAGSPGSLGVNVGTSGTLTGSSCVMKAIGNGPVLLTWDAAGTRWVFDRANSAQ